MLKKNASNPLTKQNSLSSDANRDQAWLRKKKRPSNSLRRSYTVTDDDLEELRGSIELGFIVPDSPDFNPKLSHTLPALGLYSAVHKQYNNHLYRTSSLTSESDVTTTPIVEQGDDKEKTKRKLKKWAKMVGISVRERSGERK